MALASGIIFVAIVLYTIFKKVVSFNYWHTKNVPYLEPSFPFGNLKGAGKKFHASQVILNAYNKFKSTDAKYCGIYSWKQPVAIILDLDLINRILVRDSVNFQDKDDLLSSNLFVVNGERRGKLREKFQSTFSSSKWKQIFPTVLRIGDRLHDALINTVEKDEEILEIDDLMMRYTCDQMGTFMFGECNSLRDTNVDFLQICKKIRTNNRHGPSSNAFKAPYRGFARIFRMKECSDDITNFFLGITKETIEHREQNKIHKNDLMDVLLKLKNESENENDKMTNNEIAAQLFIFLANGLEDTAILLTCCLFELAHNVDVQNKARREIQKAVKKHDGKFTYEMIMNTPYVEQVIRETLRKHTLSSTLNRLALNDYKVPDTDRVIEKGTWIKIPVRAIQSDPEYFPKPDAFDPNRFEMDKIKNNAAMLALGDAPCGCIIKRFGIMQMKVGLVKLLTNFKFSVCSKTAESIVYNLKSLHLVPKDPIYLKVHPIIRK